MSPYVLVVLKLFFCEILMVSHTTSSTNYLILSLFQAAIRLLAIYHFVIHPIVCKNIGNLFETNIGAPHLFGVLKQNCTWQIEHVHCRGQECNEMTSLKGLMTSLKGFMFHMTSRLNLKIIVTHTKKYPNFLWWLVLTLHFYIFTYWPLFMQVISLKRRV